MFGHRISADLYDREMPMLARVQGQKGREEEKLPSRLASATAVLTVSPLSNALP